MDTQKTLTEIAQLEQEINEGKTRCIPPFNLPSTPIKDLRFKTYGDALILFSRIRERMQKVHTLRNSLKVCT